MTDTPIAIRFQRALVAHKRAGEEWERKDRELKAVFDEATALLTPIELARLNQSNAPLVLLNEMLDARVSA